MIELKEGQVVVAKDGRKYEIAAGNRLRKIKESDAGSAMSGNSFDLLIDVGATGIPDNVVNLYYSIVDKKLKPTERGLETFVNEIQSLPKNVVASLEIDIDRIASGEQKRNWKNLYGSGTSATNSLFDLFRQALNYDGYLD